MFEMRGITKDFDAVKALKGASLSVRPGEIRSLLGANGSGKSTLVKVLAGLVKPDGGEVFIDGKPVRIRTSYDSKQLGIATAFQDLSLIPTMTVIDNIKLNKETVGRFGTIDVKKDRRDVEELLKLFRVRCDLDAYAQTLMPSTQSMLEVAKAVYAKPRLLLLDEVTATLHHDEIEGLFELLRKLRDEGTAIVYVTHRMKEVAKLCDSATIMRNGETVAELARDELNDLDGIVYHMTGKVPDKAKACGAQAAAAEGEALLEVSGLKYSPKVRDLSLTAYKGEILGIGGLDGQGQSEFIRLLLGEFQPEAGAIRYRGKEVRFRRPAEAVENGIGFISGERNREAIFPLRTIAENLFVGRTATGGLFKFIGNRRVNGFAREAVEKYNIKVGELEDPASSLSGGNQQKLILARELSQTPRLIIASQPARGLDIGATAYVHQRLMEERDRGGAILLISTDLDEIMLLSDRILVMYNGQSMGELDAYAADAQTLGLMMAGTPLGGAEGAGGAA